MTTDPQTDIVNVDFWAGKIAALIKLAEHYGMTVEIAGDQLVVSRQVSDVFVAQTEVQWRAAPPAAAPAAVPPTDRADLRDRIAGALVSWTYRGKDPEHGGILDTVRANAYSRADAVLSVLSPAADRAAVLLWAADRAYQIARRLDEQEHDERAQGAWDVENTLRAELRRMAAEAQQPGTEPSADLIEDYLKFLRGQGPEPDLTQLPPADREVIAGRFEIVRALADRDPELPPLDRDPVARRLGLHADEAQQLECALCGHRTCMLGKPCGVIATEHGDLPERCGCTGGEEQQPETQGRDALMAAHAALAAHAGRQQAALARIGQMADYWEQKLPEVIRTPAVVSAIRAALEPAVVPQPETVHACPPDGSGVTPCCGRTPFELPLGDRMSVDPALVTCTTPPAVVAEPGKEG